MKACFQNFGKIILLGQVIIRFSLQKSLIFNFSQKQQVKVLDLQEVLHHLIIYKNIYKAYFLFFVASVYGCNLIL